MIISHKRRYLFIETPMTGSTAISAELEANYDGEAILHKHATYQEFLVHADERERGYFVIAGVRDPLDQIVSTYLKLRSNHRERFTDPAKLWRAGRIAGLRNRKRFAFVHDEAGSFEEFLVRFHRMPFVSRLSVSAAECDFVIRFERIQADFAAALQALSIEPVRELPRSNRTDGKGDYLDYYQSDRVRRHACRIFGPFMREWGYPVPEGWPDQASGFEHRIYPVLKSTRAWYWRHFRRKRGRETWHRPPDLPG